DFAARQQDGGAEALRPGRFEEASILGAPLGGGARGVILDGEAAEHLDSVGAHARYGDFEILGADLQAYAGTEGEEFPEVTGDGEGEGHGLARSPLPDQVKPERNRNSI